MDPAPNIKEIARLLQVSVSTVSRALSDHPRIGKDTKDRVRSLANELGYVPNAQAIFFKQRKTFVIGVVLPFIKEEFFSEAISGIETAARENQYTILFGQSHDDPEREKQVVEAMAKQRVDGLIISLSKRTSNYAHLTALSRYNIPVVFFDRVPTSPDVNKVYCNIYKATQELVGWLFNKGYRRIALINGPDKLPASKDRLKGYIDSVAANKLKVDMQLVETTDLSRESNYAAMENLLKLKKHPQAVITFNEYVHMDVVQYAIRQGIAVNKEIIFVSYANLPITTYTAYPPVVSIEQYPYSQGEKAMQMMMELLQCKDDCAPQTLEISPSLIAYQPA